MILYRREEKSGTVNRWPAIRLRRREIYSRGGHGLLTFSAMSEFGDLAMSDGEQDAHHRQASRE